ncbi:MAG: prolipoprotein diacylglyceryl transferase [Clostridiales bacterium]|nr:prolipoprotein diacylglyceryl transferase [Clostridiales bacterium]
MYPYLFHLHSLPSYIVLICIGILAALILYRILAFKVGISEESFRFYGVIFIVSIGLGFVFARLFQMLYNYIETGEVGTGITFLGGLVGGVATFFVLILIFGKKYRNELFKTVNVAMPCIALGHCLGRIGCFLAGCCYGAKTDSFLGVKFVDYITSSGEWIYFDTPRMPTQLIEAIFLLLLCIALILFIFRLDKLDFLAVAYLYSYSVFRFLIEFVRDDPRGAFILGLSPSQIICIIMFIGAVVLNVLLIRRKTANQSSPTE